MSKVLVVVDMQNDFVTDALRNEEGIKIVPNVVKKVKNAVNAGDKLIFTRDTHEEDYLTTEEGKNLPVVHCIKGTKGWEIIDALEPFTKKAVAVIDKPAFGSVELAKKIEDMARKDDKLEVELIGLCTDICVVSNALVIKAFNPNIHISVDSTCCAGVTPETHKAALETMKTCHVEVK